MKSKQTKRGEAKPTGAQTCAIVQRFFEIRPVPRSPRTGWAQDSQRLVATGDDGLVWPEWANKGDQDLMVSRASVVRGEIWLTNLDSTVGSEIQKTRPCVVISSPEMHDYLRTIMVAPMTTGFQPAAFRLPLTFQGKSGLVLLDQLRTLDKVRLVQRLGAVQSATLEKILITLQEVFAP